MLKFIYDSLDLADDDALEQDNSRPKIILAHGYGVTKNGSLPKTTQLVLDKAISLYNTSIWFASTNYLKGSPASCEHNMKLSYCRGLKWSSKTRILSIETFEISSTIDEIDLFVKELSRFNLANYQIISICDKLHARRVRAIWKKLYPKIEIEIIGIGGVWNDEMPSIAQQTRWLWRLANWTHLISFKIFGRKINNLTHASLIFQKKKG